jgi:hypothetical protein
VIAGPDDAREKERRPLCEQQRASAKVRIASFADVGQTFSHVRQVAFERSAIDTWESPRFKPAEICSNNISIAIAPADEAGVIAASRAQFLRCVLIQPRSTAAQTLLRSRRDLQRLVRTQG